MKPVRAIVDRDIKPAIRVTIVRKPASPDRYRRLVHLLAVLLDKPDNPDEKGQL